MKLKKIVLLVTSFFISHSSLAEEGSPFSHSGFEILMGYSLSTSYDSYYQGSLIIQNATDAANITLRYLRSINSYLDFGLEGSMESNRTFIGRTTNGVAFAYLNPVPNLTVFYSELFCRYNYKTLYISAGGGYNLPLGYNFPAGFRSSWVADMGIGWRASESFIFEITYRMTDLLSGYYDSFKQKGFLLRVGYKF